MKNTAFIHKKWEDSPIAIFSKEHKKEILYLSSTSLRELIQEHGKEKFRKYINNYHIITSKEGREIINQINRA